ncbi:sulfur carrier protein ThiS [Xanthomonadaceae bacterium JHOS43]|nr:sulfur carrier protein ThiS [Xanthomonadaceae bacterium JHOS43]MCX7563390.1 sulfur carrier protein ThiS [Xanthomonadaceae bacterium XH05]
MNIVLNGTPTTLPSSLSISGLLAHLTMEARRVAVEVNQEIVPRSQHDTHLLAEGDQVELVHAMGGG